MKGRGKTIFLVCVVIAVWGYAAFSFFGTFSGGNYNYSLTDKKMQAGNTDYKIDDSFTLLASYRDPFLREVPRSVISKANISSDKIKAVKSRENGKEKIIAKPVDISFILFHGIVNNPETKKKIALVSIHDKQYMASEGEKIEEVSFIKNGKDSVLISFEDKSFYIKRK
jgi:hypothetical protein